MGSGEYELLIKRKNPPPKNVHFSEICESLYAKLSGGLVHKSDPSKRTSGQAYKGDSDSWRIRHADRSGLFAGCYK